MELFSGPVSGGQTFGPFDVPDDLHILSIAIARCTKSDLATWSDPNTIVRLSASLSFNSVLRETFSPETWAGGVASAKDGQVAESCGVTYGPMPLLCTCGQLFHPGDPVYEAGKEKSGDPNYVGQGSLAHSTVAFKAGKGIADAKLSTNETRLKTATTADDFARTTLPGWSDKQIFDRTFHSPTAVLPALRSVTVLVEVLSGPNLESRLTVEVR